jgi:molybdopterin-binding protein
MHALVTSYNSGTGVLVVDVNHHTGSGTYTAWTVNVGGMVPLQSVEWGEILGTLGNQTDLSTALNAKLDSTTAASTYAPIASPTFTGTVTIPAGASISGFAPLASPALTGNVTINSNSTGAALFIEQLGTGNILTLHDQATDTNFVAIDANGKFNTVPSEATNGAGFNIPHGTAPTTPVNGDIWTTTTGLFMRQNGSTQQYVSTGETQTIGGNKTFSNATNTFGSSTATGTTGLATGATLSGSTKTVNIGTSGVSGSTTNITVGPVAGASTTTIGATTAASTLNLATGATATATTKAVNIGTAGVAGSTTNIAIGSTTGTSTTTLQGSTVGVTLAADTNTTGLATTAYVVGQAGSATPLVNGTAAVGTSLRFARQDHVHPTDTSRAALASPTFTGVPAAPTAAVDTNTTQLATTAFVVGQAAAATPLVNGTAAVGTSLRYARADHVHPTDTTRAPLASPAFTGTPSLPTGTTAVTQSAGNNTTAVATTAFVQQEVPAASTTAAGKVELATRLEVVEPSSSTLAVSPMRVLDVVMSPGYVQIAQNNGNVSTGTVGTGAGVFTTSMTRVCLGPNASVAGSSYYRPQTNGGVAQFYAKGINNASINFSKPFWMSGRSSYDDTHRGDANNTSRVTVGKSGTTIGALTQKGIGWQKVGGLATNFFLLAHNGTTLTSVDTNTSLNSLGITGGVPFDWSIYSDGSGNVTMFINDVQVATTSAGPTGYSLGSSVWQEEVDQSASAATRMYLTTFGGHYYHA